jgi:putative restriction endonuclease
MDINLERELRMACFAWVKQQTFWRGERLSGGVLRRGFNFLGERVPLAVQQGIHKPKFVEAALTLRTSFNSTYHDYFDSEGYMVYKYRGQDPNLWDNRSARLAFEANLPLLYLHGVSENPSEYLPIWPTYIVDANDSRLEFRLQFSSKIILEQAAIRPDTTPLDNPIERKYQTREVRVRLHQENFRKQVLSAYSHRCSMCRLPHQKLLEAAHITPDADEFGDPVVPNGLSLCRIHHRAFDVKYLSVNPEDLRIHVLPSLLRENEVPMFRHSIQDLEGKELVLPRLKSDSPDPIRLLEHWKHFREVADV